MGQFLTGDSVKNSPALTEDIKKASAKTKMRGKSKKTIKILKEKMDDKTEKDSINKDKKDNKIG